MQIDIPSHIEKLLFLHESLVIPGFGGFTATRTPASTDYVGGTVNAPAKMLAFSENLTIDDGILINDIMLTHAVSAEDAQRVVHEFVEKMQSLLNQREIVTLPGVGRLYKNYVQKIQFLPDATNFNSASYGLPPLQFSPIARAREVNEELAAEPLPPAPPVMPEPTYAQQRSGATSVGTALGIFFLLASLAAAIWYWQHKKQKDAATPDKTEKAAETTQNEPEKEKTIETPAATETPVETTDNNAAESLKAREEAVRNQVKNGRQCILIVATLSVKENADKLKNLLAEEGFDVYYLHKNGHQVGIQFYYTDPEEIKEKTEALQRVTGEKRILVKKR
ncbi:MAG: hypothetical protein JNJ57_10600 [Saprospiraceae bacterium]|nr:hypothetical protein [Saprospiraceae bacterium]